MHAHACLSVRLSATVCVSTPLRLLVTSGMMWHDMNPDWLNKFYNCYMEVLVGSNSRRDLRIEARHRYLPKKGKLVLYVIHYFDCKRHLKQLL